MYFLMYFFFLFFFQKDSSFFNMFYNEKIYILKIVFLFD